MKLLKVYLRKEHTLDQITGKPFRFDVVAYASRSDAKTGKVKARWDWFQSNRPTRRNRRVMLNCAQWSIIWLPDSKA